MVLLQIYFYTLHTFLKQQNISQTVARTAIRESLYLYVTHKLSQLTFNNLPKCHKRLVDVFAFLEPNPCSPSLRSSLAVTNKENAP